MKTFYRAIYLIGICLSVCLSVRQAATHARAATLLRSPTLTADHVGSFNTWTTLSGVGRQTAVIVEVRGAGADKRKIS